MENSLAVANYFIEKSFQTGNELTPMKLVKLAYITHGWHLALTGKPLITEAMLAWEYGPVINSLYHTFRPYGNKQILKMEFEFNGSQMAIPKVNESIKPFLDRIWEVYGLFTGIQLSSITHQPDTPWHNVWHDRGDKKNKVVVIPNDLIRLHYKEKANAGIVNNPAKH